MLILTSSNAFVAQHFIQHLPKQPSEMRLTFIPTAAEVEKGDKQWLAEDRKPLVDAGFQVIDFTLTGKTKSEVQVMLEGSDVVFVAGGNTFFLLQEMRKSGFADLIKSYVDKGLIYGGSSAGSSAAGIDISLSKELDDPALAPELTDYQGLELIDVAVFPHWGSEHFHNRYEKVMKAAYKKGLKIILLTDDQYLLVEDGRYTIESV
ncbi:Type 1 glutamine amidotransferase-like domain-containing protein [Candidatus Woesebacteria bacterium]|nr:Type 1 glutamine amidotransferase-like domain-containing protein [Candidatus Woesebacteria bacterium]